ncbi:MAG TPA: TIGR03435 family protein [Acidobacteriaceae bacterium]|nr:TIGR03435 family protein [Acidobacteriaceae bacterium]
MKEPLRRGVLFAPALLAAFTFTARSQAPAPQPAAPSFEVAIVRLGDPNPAPFGPNDEPLSHFPTNHFYARNLPLKLILGIAFGVDQRYVDGGPSWLDTQNYWIDAKVEGDQQLPGDQMKPLLQNLLVQRLGLKVHHESRLVAGYEMVLAKGGTKLQPAKGERSWGSIGPDQLSGAKVSASTIAQFLSYSVRQPVIDKTGLTGSYDIKLSYAPLNDPNATSNNPDIFTAVQEQLGLKLVPAKVPVDYLVIDHVNRVPAEN